VKMVAQSITILVILVYVNYRQRFAPAAEVGFRQFRDVCIWATLVITIYSGLAYVQTAVALYRRSKLR